MGIGKNLLPICKASSIFIAKIDRYRRIYFLVLFNLVYEIFIFNISNILTIRAYKPLERRRISTLNLNLA